MTIPQDAPKRSGFAAIIGAPNAGKSTLVNRLVGSKVSIVTQKIQTTRFPVRGVVMAGRSQIVLVDTPGIFSPKRRLDRAMVRAAQTQAADADAVVHLVDAAAEVGTNAADKKAVQDSWALAEAMAAAGTKVILALNKIDAIKRDQLLEISRRYFETGAYSEAFMISALNGSGVEDLKARLAELMPQSEWLYPEDQAADMPVRLLAAEITREKLYLRIHEELPYQLTVETTAFDERPDGSVRIEQTIYVQREGHRPIILGKGGQTIKVIGQAAREELGAILERPVHLMLHVKVRETWQEERGFYTGVGLDFDV
jgi:GTP-binding protein Era